MNFPENLKYSKEHTWLKQDGDVAKIGITEFAQSELGEIVYVDLPRVGQSFKENEVFGSIEAVKTTSDLFMPVTGTVTQLNARLLKEPTLVNSEPFDNGWLIEIKISNPDEIKILLDASNYKELTGN